MSNSSKTHVLPQSSSMVERLNRLMKIFHGDDRVLVVINADPDAISSAMAFKRLLWRKTACVNVARTNVIKRPDNLALIQFIKMPIVHINEISPQEFNKRVLLDSQPHHQDILAGLSFDVVIDHHPLGEANKAPFVDVRPDYGANATILTEYLRAAKIKPSRNLATALFYGIKTDTANFVRQGQIEDMKAFRFLFPLINQNMVSKIENSEMTRASLKHFQRALNRVKLKKKQAYVFMDRVDNPDTLVMMADFFMRVHDIHFSIASGIAKDKVVVIFRVAGDRKNAGKWASEAFGPYGSAGGHKAMARAEIPLSNLDSKVVEKEGALERFLLNRINKSNRSVKTKN